jgi:hypothetical protein
LGFECSFDGSPFEECISPKPYANLQTEEGHIFKVRAKGILGNTDKSPDTFNFTTITSSSVRGIIKNSTTDVGGAKVWIDSKNLTTNTDSKGRFFFNGVGEGIHSMYISPNYPDSKPYTIRNNFTDKFFVSAGSESAEVNFDLISITPEIHPPSKQITNPNQQNINFKQVSAASNNTHNYTVNLVQQSELTHQGKNKFLTNISLSASNDTLSKIKNVTYYLHPTFKPNTVTVFTRENKFALSFTNWGVFLLTAKVYFHDDTIDLTLPPNQWKIPK